MPRAWHSLAGPLHRSRSRRAPGRAARMASSPATGARARSSTALGRPLGAADDVGAPVHPVGEIDVQVARRAEHGGVARASGPGRRGRPGPPRPGRPPPRRCGPPDRRGTQQLVQQPGRDLRPEIAGRGAGAVRPVGFGATSRVIPAELAERPVGAPPAAERPGLRRTRRGRGRRSRRRPEALQLDSATEGLGPPAPAGPAGVVRRVTATPGLEQLERLASRGAGGPRPARPAGTRRSSESRTRAPTSAWAWRNGMPRLDQPLGQVDGGRGGPSAAPCMRSVSKVDRGAAAPSGPPGPGVTWSSASKRGSLSSWRSRL